MIGAASLSSTGDGEVAGEPGPPMTLGNATSGTNRHKQRRNGFLKEPAV